MKKLIVLILAAFMILSFVACDNSSGPNTEDTTNDKSGGISNVGDSNDQSSNSGEGSDSKDKIDVTRITTSTEFSEGKAWVRYGELTSDERKTLYCINKKGEILFTLTDTFLNSPSSFQNGLSVVPMMIDGEGVYCLCDEVGHVTKPSDVGATEFLIRSDYSVGSTHAAFQDGYIFAKKTDATFSGSSETVAILNSELEVITGYSEAILDLYEEYIHSDYYNGYLYSTHAGKVFDLNSGKEVEDLDEFLASFEPQYASDMWGYDPNSFVYYDILATTYTKTLDLSQYGETISQMYVFSEGTAPLVFDSADKAFFTVVKEDGSFAFEPVELSGHSGCSVRVYKGKFLVVSATGTKYCLETFDLNGKIAETTVTVTGFSPSVKFNDDVVFICSTDMNSYYSLDLKPLF